MLWIGGGNTSKTSSIPPTRLPVRKQGREQWTSSITSAASSRVRGSLPNQSTCVLWIWRGIRPHPSGNPVGGSPGLLGVKGPGLVTSGSGLCFLQMMWSLWPHLSVIQPSLKQPGDHGSQPGKRWSAFYGSRRSPCPKRRSSSTAGSSSCLLHGEVRYKRLKWASSAGWLGPPLEIGWGARSRAAAPPHWEQSDEVVQASTWDASQTPLCWGG